MNGVGADAALRSLPEGVRNELLSLYDVRHLRYHDAAIADLVRLSEGLRADGRQAAWLEIGSNTGAFLVGLGGASTWERPAIGVEWTAKLARAADERIARKGVERSTVGVAADARVAVPVLVPPDSLDAVFVLFPDPWWKPRHAARRILEPLMLRVLARRVRPGGRLYVKSDVFTYLHGLREMAAASRAWRPLRATEWPDEANWALSTRERKCMDAAVPFGRGYYERDPSFDGALPGAPEKADMFAFDTDVDPESVIRGPAPIDRDGWVRGKQRAADGPATG